MSHVTHTNESCHTHEMKHLTDAGESVGRLYMSLLALFGDLYIFLDMLDSQYRWQRCGDVSPLRGGGRERRRRGGGVVSAVGGWELLEQLVP